MKSKTSLVIMLAFLLTVTSGCSGVKGALAYLLGSKSGAQPKAKTEEKLWLGQPAADQPATPRLREVLVYFPNARGELQGERRQVDANLGIGKVTLQELLKGPRQQGFYPAVPAGTKLLGLKIQPDGLAVVDFSRELKANFQGGSQQEITTLWAIVNTLGQFPTVKQVQILVEGKVVETLGGHVEINRPLSPDQTLVAVEKK